MPAATSIPVTGVRGSIVVQGAHCGAQIPALNTVNGSIEIRTTASLTAVLPAAVAHAIVLDTPTVHFRSVFPCTPAPSAGRTPPPAA